MASRHRETAEGRPLTFLNALKLRYTTGHYSAAAAGTHSSAFSTIATRRRASSGSGRCSLTASSAGASQHPHGGMTAVDQRVDASVRARSSVSSPSTGRL
jgi:hypothetical protein